MSDSAASADARPPRPTDVKLRAALAYLGDRLSTHRASRFRLPRHFVLDEWLATRRLDHAARGAAEPGVVQRRTPLRPAQDVHRPQ